jgi:hypothetical protein
MPSDKQTLRVNFFKVEMLKKDAWQWTLDMNYNSRYNSVEEFRTAFKIKKKKYAQKLEEEKIGKNRIERQQIETEGLYQPSSFLT